MAAMTHRHRQNGPERALPLTGLDSRFGRENWLHTEPAASLAG